MENFTGCTAFITGAGSGIGQALAEALASSEVRNVIISDINREGLEQTVENVRALGGRTEAHILDTGNRDAVHEMANQIHAKHDGADIVLNCAGIAQSSTVEDLTYDDMERVMRVNFWGMVYCTKAFLPHLIEKGRGNLVNISSVFGLFGVPNQSAYCSSKFGIRGFTESLAHEHNKSEIIISSVHPGGIATNIVRNMKMPQDSTEEDIQNAIERFEEFTINTPAYAAQTIIKGMRKGKQRILIGRDARFMDRIQRLMPAAYGRILFRKMNLFEELEGRKKEEKQ
jgi:NAD(P)-dependent dehydrogenase (short-subunit alcohol dehydrogenase family)